MLARGGVAAAFPLRSPGVGSGAARPDAAIIEMPIGRGARSRHQAGGRGYIARETCEAAPCGGCGAKVPRCFIFRRPGASQPRAKAYIGFLRQIFDSRSAFARVAPRHGPSPSDHAKGRSRRNGEPFQRPAFPSGEVEGGRRTLNSDAREPFPGVLKGHRWRSPSPARSVSASRSAASPKPCRCRT